VGVHADITAQAQAEAKLRQSEAELRDERDRIRDYLHVAEVMILVLADTGCIRTINRRGAEILGYNEPEALIGRDWFELAVPPAHRTETRAVFAKLMAGELDAVSAYENPVLRADGEERLVAWRNTLLKDAQGRIVGTLSSGDDITDERLAQEREQLLAQEIDHRAKNLLAVVQSVVQLTRTEDIHGFKEAVTGRIQSLARTHGLLAAARWEGADLKQLVADELAPYSRNDPSRANISGPNVQLIPAAAQAFALAIHELATNSAKYGSLGASTGRLSVSWQWEVGAEPCLLFRWVENGGPPVIPPTRRGFGSVVLQSSIEGQLKGAVHLDWRAEGLVCELLLPSAEVIAHGKGAHERKIIQPNSTRTVRTSKQLRILVVENEALVAAQIEDVLEACGHQVCVVSRLADAFDRLYRLELDVALLDINVAGERSYPLADLLLAKGVPFAFCSGYGENAGLPARLSYIPLVAKPFDRDDLVSTVTALLG
jgi:PAS domain S-box-containing protein